MYFDSIRRRHCGFWRFWFRRLEKRGVLTGDCHAGRKMFLSEEFVRIQALFMNIAYDYRDNQVLLFMPPWDGLFGSSFYH